LNKDLQEEMNTRILLFLNTPLFTYPGIKLHSHQKPITIETAPYSPSRVAKGAVKIRQYWPCEKVMLGMLAKKNPLRVIRL
jgi:hypothetical protein